MKLLPQSALVAATIACCALTAEAQAATALPKSPIEKSAVLAKVNDEEITVRQMLALFTSKHGGHAKFLGGKEEASHFLNILIEDRLLIQEAYFIGLDEDPTAKELVRQFTDSKSSSLLIKREIEEKSKPTKDEIKAIWENELQSVLKARQIAVFRKEEAEEIRAAILYGEEPEWFARNCSVASSARNGGNAIIGWGRMEPALERAVFELEPGEISPVIETMAGYEIIALIDRIETPRPELDKVASDIESVLAKRKLEQVKADFSNELWARYEVAIPSADLSPQALLSARQSAPDTVLAKWKGGELALKDIAEADELRAWATIPPRMAAVDIDTRLRMSVNGELVVLEARRRNLADEPDLAAEIEAHQDLVVESLLFRDKIFRTLAVTDEEARKYFEEHRGEFAQQEERHVAHILVPSEADAARVRKELTAGADFAEVAKKSSKDFASAGSGGDLGWITASKVPPSFKEVLSMNAGEISNPMKSESGWHIVKLIEIRPARILEFEEARGRLTESALDAKKREARQYWIDKLRAAAKIVTYDAAVEKFVKDNEMTSFTAPPPQHEIPAGELKSPK